MTWMLYLDDKNSPVFPERWVVARSSTKAIIEIMSRKELPKFMSLDHDLGEDSVMRFLKEIRHIWEMWNLKLDDIPEYFIHSGNNVECGVEEIKVFMRDWKANFALSGKTSKVIF